MAADNRLLGADFVRASACCVVLAHHLAQRIDGRSALGQHPLAHMFNIVGGFGVAMFFVLSGFLLARPFWQAFDRSENLPSLRTYALRRLARIAPGFWLALTVSLVLSITVFGFRLDFWLIWRYLAGLFLISDWHWTTYFPVEIDGPLWSIGMEVSSYVMLPIGFWGLFALGRGRLGAWQARIGWLLVIAAALLAHWLFFNLVQVNPIKKGWNNGLQGGAKVWMPWFNPFGFFAMFAIGALASGVQVQLARVKSVAFDVAAVIAIAAAAWLLWQYGSTEPSDFHGFLGIPYDYPIYHVVIGVILALTPSTVLVGRLLDNPVVAYIAKISFGLYVWHYIILELVRLYWLPDIDHGMMDRPDRFAMGALAILGITGVIASLSYHWLEAPVIRWARGLEERRAHPARRADLSPEGRGEEGAS